MKLILNFLRNIEQNNDRTWFHEHKQDYELALREVNNVGQRFIDMVQSIDNTTMGITLKDCTYRFYRDTRFSADKTPYKVHFAIYAACGGKKGGLAGYYLHLQDKNSFFAGGLYRPKQETLSKLRMDMVNNTAKWEALLLEPNVIENFGTLDDFEMLTKVPRGIPKDFRYTQWVKQKNMLLTHRIENKTLEQSTFLSQLLLDIKIVKPFVSHINDVIL